MKVLFVVPDLNYVGEYMPDYTGSLSLGIAYMSAVLKQAGHETALIHITRPREPREYQAEVERACPDLVAFTCFTHQWPMVKELAGWTKGASDAPTICGGVHATIDPESVLANPNIDMVCLGEGEDALLEICDRLQAGGGPVGVGSIWAKTEDGLLRNAVRPLRTDLDSLPLPDRGLFESEGLVQDKSGAFGVLATRGCPYKCTYCCNHQYQELYPNPENYIRTRSVDNLLDEIRLGVEDCPQFTRIVFLDDTLCLNKRWLSEFAEKYPRTIGLPFAGNVRANLMTEDVMELLTLAGCCEVGIGIESGSTQLRRELLGRSISDAQIVGAVERCRHRGIRAMSYNMVGLPEETKRDALDTVRLNVRARVDSLHVSILQPYPHTRLHELCLERGYISGDEVSTFFGRSVLDQPSMSPQETQFAYRYFAILFRLLSLSQRMPSRVSEWMQRGLEKAWMTSHDSWYLRLQPVAFGVVFPVQGAKRAAMRFFPKLARRAKACLRPKR